MNDFPTLFGVLDDFFLPSSGLERYESKRVYSSPIRGFRTRSKVGGTEIEADLPGFSRKDVRVTVEAGILVIQAERKGQKWTKTYPLGNGVDSEKVKAKMENGRLRVFVPGEGRKLVEVNVE